MNIGLDLRIIGPRHGGIGRYCYELAHRILTMDAHTTYVLFFNEHLTDPEVIHSFRSYPNARIVLTGIRHYSLREQAQFHRVLNAHNLDLMHFMNFNVPIFYNRPFIVTIHDTVHHKISGAKKSRLLHFYAYIKIIEHAAKKSQRIITVSEFSKSDIHTMLHVPLEKIHVIYEGTSLDTNVTTDEVEDIRRKYILRKPYVLFVGVLERKKNVVGLAKGFDAFIRNYKIDCDLVIAGKADSHYPEIKNTALEIKSKDHLVFTGYVTDEELSALYKGAHGFVSASLHEGFGLPGVEAMKFGIPLVVSNIAVFNEIYDNAALYFDPLDMNDIADKMYLLMRDEAFRNQLGNNAIQRAQMFNWERTAQETLALYNSYSV